MGNKSSKSVACAQTPEIHGEQIRKICFCAQTPMLVLPAWAFTVKPYTRRRGKWTSPCHIERPVSIFPVIQQRREQDHEAGPRIVDKRARRRRQSTDSVIATKLIHIDSVMAVLMVSPGRTLKTSPLAICPTGSGHNLFTSGSLTSISSQHIICMIMNNMFRYDYSVR